MDRLERYANAIASGIASVFPIFLVIYSILGVCIGVGLGLASLAVPVNFDQQTYDNIAIFLAVLSLLISVIVCMGLTRFLLEYFKYHTWEEMMEDSMLE